MTFLQVGEDLAGGEVHRREQVDRAVAFVVVGHRAGPARLHRQRGLGAIQRLALGFLVEAEHHRPRRRVEIQADDIDQLLLERGSLLILNVSTRHGLRPWSAQIRATASLPIPTRAAIDRVLQCVDPSAGRS